jgi:hypothetical protein
MALPPMVGHQKKLLSIRNKIYERLKATFFCSPNTCPNLLPHQKSRLWLATGWHLPHRGSMGPRKNIHIVVSCCSFPCFSTSDAHSRILILVCFTQVYFESKSKTKMNRFKPNWTDFKRQRKINLNLWRSAHFGLQCIFEILIVYDPL